MATTNFKFQKRQKELERKKKTEEKKQRKLERSDSHPSDSPDEAAEEETVSQAG